MTFEKLLANGRTARFVVPIQRRPRYGRGLGDVEDQPCGKGCVIYWRGEVNPGWWSGGNEDEQNAFLNQVAARIKNAGGPLVSDTRVRALSVHRGGIFGTTYQKIIDASITVQLGMQTTSIWLIRQLIEQSIQAEGASINAGTVHVQVAQNPSDVGPPAVSPDDFYQPTYDYPSFPQLPSLDDFFAKLKPDPTSGVSLAVIALLAVGGFLVFKTLRDA